MRRRGASVAGLRRPPPLALHLLSSLRRPALLAIVAQVGLALGPQVSARLEHGEKREFLEEAASRTYETPDGRCVRFAWRTLETLDRAGLVGADTPKATVVRLLRHVRSA